MIYGCGAFGDSAWTELVTTEGGRSDAAHALLRHIESCAACRAEYVGLARIDHALRSAIAGAPEAKAAIAARIAADAAAARRDKGKATRLSDSYRRESRPPLRRLISRPAALAWTSSLVLVIAVASGVLWGPAGLWPGGQGPVGLWRSVVEAPARSTGYTAPGGTILSRAEPTEPFAAALTTQGAASAAAAVTSAASPAAAGSEGGPTGADSGARPIRTSLGFASAVAGEI